MAPAHSSSRAAHPHCVGSEPPLASASPATISIGTPTVAAETAIARTRSRAGASTATGVSAATLTEPPLPRTQVTWRNRIVVERAVAPADADRTRDEPEQGRHGSRLGRGGAVERGGLRQLEHDERSGGHGGRAAVDDRPRREARTGDGLRGAVGLHAQLDLRRVLGADHLQIAARARGDRRIRPQHLGDRERLGVAVADVGGGRRPAPPRRPTRRTERAAAP